MRTKKKTEELKTVKIETTDSVKAIIADCLTKKMLITSEIKALQDRLQYNEEKLNAILIAFAEGNGYKLSDYNIVEYCDHARYIVVDKKD